MTSLNGAVYSSLSELGQAALQYAVRGWKVFPLAPIGQGISKENGKEPYPGSQGFRDASDDPHQIQSWWTNHPDANIGLSLAASGLVALDVDTYKDPGAWEAFEGAHPIPPTYQQSTPGGGTHFLFQAKDEASYPGKIDGIPGEVKHNGYIVLAPSMAKSAGNNHQAAAYVCERDVLPLPAPGWLAPTRQKRSHSNSSSFTDADLLRHKTPERKLIDELNKRENTFSDREVWLKVLHGVHHEYFGTEYEKEAKAAVVAWSARWQGAGGEVARTDDTLRDNAAYAWNMAKPDRDDPVKAGTALMLLRNMPYVANDQSAYELPSHKVKNLAQHKPIPWLYGKHYMRGGLSLTVAPGGTDKSLLALDDALSIATGTSLMGEHTYGPKRVLYMNGGEDSKEIVAARVDAAMSFHKITEADLGGRLFVAGAPELAKRMDLPDLKFAVETKREGLLIDEGLVSEMIRFLKANHIDVLILDPLKHFHLVPENDNDLMNELAMVFVRIAQKANCAVEVVHHATKEARTRSGSLGIAQSRGAGALLDKARTARFLSPMTKEEAENYGVNEPEQHVRVTEGKSNYGRKSESGRWFSIQSVEMGNATKDYPRGDTVGVLKRFKPSQAQDSGQRLALYAQALPFLSELPNGLKSSDRSLDWTERVNDFETVAFGL